MVERGNFAQRGKDFRLADVVGMEDGVAGFEPLHALLAEQTIDVQDEADSR